MTKKVAILVEDHYQTLEAWYPYLRLREDGYDTHFIGTGRKKEYQSKEGYPAVEESSVQNVNAEDFSCVIIPGGYAPDMLRRHKKICEFVRTLFNDGRTVAAICHGGWVLVSSGVLKGKRATSFYAIKDDIMNAGAEYIDKDVVVDENLITSRDPYDLPVFCREIINALKKTERAAVFA